MKKGLYSKKDIMPHSIGAKDSVAERKARNTGNYNHELLRRCQTAWESKRRIRETRDRVMSYVYGDQWGDIIESKNGQITEREFLQRRNNAPLSNNIMISILNSVVGLYAKQGTEPVCFARTRDSQALSDMMSATMQANWQDTEMPDVLKVIFEDALMGGVLMARETYECRDHSYDCWTDYINPNYAFWEAGSDPRHSDLTLIGVLRDCPLEELYAAFTAQGLTIDQIDEMFRVRHRFRSETEIQQNEVNSLGNVSFDSPSDSRLYRVIEAWTKETKVRWQCYDPTAKNSSELYFRRELDDIDDILEQNEIRKRQYMEVGMPEEEWVLIEMKKIVDVYWYYTYLTPEGEVICEGETPYDFDSHPFTLKLHPFVNGEVHPFMANIIDQQRYINRLIIMHDMAARSAAKGITIVPKTAVPDDMTDRQFADQFTSYDGLVFYEPNKATPNLRPEIITSNAVQIGTYELLQLQLELAKDITNVSGALQGKTPSAGTSAARYAQETQNSTTSLFSLIQDMSSFTEAVARKKCTLIKQFYEDGRMIMNKDNTAAFEYDRMATRDVMYKISVKEAAATASTQMKNNDDLKELLLNNRISTIQYLQNINASYADSLLQSMQSEQAQMEYQQNLQNQIAQMEQGMSPQQMQQAQQNLQAARNMLAS
jgi:hypothetical protein